MKDQRVLAINSIRDAVDDKNDSSRLPLPVNVLVVLDHQRRRPRICDILLEAHVTLYTREDSYIHVSFLNSAILWARILQLLRPILKHPMHMYSMRSTWIILRDSHLLAGLRIS